MYKYTYVMIKFVEKCAVALPVDVTQPVLHHLNPTFTQETRPMVHVVLPVGAIWAEHTGHVLSHE